MNKDNTKSYLMLCVSMMIFGTIGIFRSYIAISSSLLAFLRGIIGSAFLWIYLKIRGKKLSRGTDKKSFILLIITGAMIGFNWILLFEAYNYTSVATATLCYYMEPTILILLSPIVLRESLSLKRILCAIISITGMALVSGVFPNGSINSSDLKGIIYGLMAAVLYAVIILINKKIQLDDAYLKTIVQLAFAAIALIPYILMTVDFGKEYLDSKALILILIVGIVHTGIAYALYFGGMKNVKAQSIAVLSYIDPVFALILSALILNERMDIYGLTGAVLIISSSLISELGFKKNDV